MIQHDLAEGKIIQDGGLLAAKRSAVARPFWGHSRAVGDGEISQLTPNTSFHY